MSRRKLSSAADLEKAVARAKRGRGPRKALVQVCGGTGCLAKGGAEVRDALEREIAASGVPAVAKLEVRGTGCHGFCEQGPMVVIRPRGIVYRGVKPKDAAAIVTKTLAGGEVIKRLLVKDPATKKRHEKKADMPFYAGQERVALRRCGEIDPGEIDDALAAGGYLAFAKAVTSLSPGEVIDEVVRSGLRGRGGAGFPTGLKWLACREAEGPRRVVMNAGGLLESDPHSALEGMLLCAFAVSAEEAIVYVREEYPLAADRIERAVAQARELGLVGEDVLGSGFSCEVRVVRAGGGFVAGESSAIMTFLSGGVGEPRAKYVHATALGVDGRPTVVNNVETLSNVPVIVDRGPEAFRAIGTRDCPGTKVLALGGRVRNTGIAEVPMGTPLSEVVHGIGGGVAGDRELKGIQIGGPSGGLLPADRLDLPLTFSALEGEGAILGSGGVVVMDDRTCVVDVAKYFTRFLGEESCGKCTPCRDGLPALLAILTRIGEGEGEPADLERIRSLAEVVGRASLCGLGRTAVNPVLTAIRNFEEEFRAHIEDRRCPAGVCRALTTFEIDAELCNGCRICARNCPAGAISGERKKVHVLDVEICDRCGICRSVCPNDAIVAV